MKSEELVKDFGFAPSVFSAWERHYQLLKVNRKCDGIPMTEAIPNKIGHPNYLMIVRTFDSPREKVWKAWTEPNRFVRWWGPKGFTTPVFNIDLRLGGKYLYCMRSPEGQDFWGTGIFREIKEPERLVITDSFADPKGNIVPASYYGLSEGFPLQMLIAVTFEEQDGRTRLVLEHSGIGSISTTDRENMQQGWNESLDKLAGYLKGF